MNQVSDYSVNYFILEAVEGLKLISKYLMCTLNKNIYSKNDFFFLFTATPIAYTNSRAKGRIRDAAAGLHYGQGNAGSELHLQPTPQLAAMMDT